jgi:hypothetical protein
MINTTGFMAVMDHGITINWDDGPTLHKIAAQVRYHTGENTSSATLRLTASQRYSDDPLTFMVMGGGLRATWVWQERSPGWTVQLAVQNDGEEDVYIDSLDVIRIDTAFGGLFNIGAPTGLWQAASESAGLLAAPADATSESQYESWSAGSTTANGFTRNREFIVQPSASNRSRPPALMIRALDASAGMTTEIIVEMNGERFERAVARARTDGMLIANGVIIASPEFWIVAGDDVDELRRL